MLPHPLAFVFPVLEILVSAPKEQLLSSFPLTCLSKGYMHTINDCWQPTRPLTLHSSGSLLSLFPRDSAKQCIMHKVYIPLPSPVL